MDLIVELKQRVLHLTLNRSLKRNALNRALCLDLVNAIRSAQERPDVRAILIGAYGPVFCSGMDLDEAIEMEDESLSAIHEQLFTIGSGSLKPIVIGVNGPALGGGMGLVAQGHVVIAAHDARFALPEIRIGLWPFLVYRSIEAAIGPRRTFELSLTGRHFYAEDALNWGLVHQTDDLAEVGVRSTAIAQALADSSPLAITAGLEYLHQSRGKSWSEAGGIAQKLREEIMRGDDFREGYAAFKERRRPKWPSMPAEWGAAK